jgi:threonine/homoserine/homoserine lactone efflux protein
MLSYIIQGIFYGFAAAVQPGPFQTYIISQTLIHGKERTLPSVLAPLISDGPIILMVMLILTRLPLLLVILLRVVGGLYIGGLAVGALRAYKALNAGSPQTALANHRGLLKAVIVNMLNPSVYLYWSLVTGPILVIGWREAHAKGIGFLMGFYLTVIVALACIVMLSDASGRIGPAANRKLRFIAAVTLFGFGLYQVGMGMLGYLEMHRCLYGQFVLPSVERLDGGQDWK